MTTSTLAVKLPLVALAAISLPLSAAAQAGSVDRVRADISYLADDERTGRGVGTEGLDAAARYIAEALEEAGLEPGGSSGYLQPFTIDASAPAAAHAGIANAEVANVIGIRRGSGALAEGVVVVGAHYDHLGLGGFGSLDPDSIGVVHNGADDNASGTVAMLEIARLLRSRTAPDVRTLVFVAFTAEELGLIGSARYVSAPARPLDSTFAMVNLDMVGRLRESRLAAFGSETAVEFPELLDSVNTSLGVEEFAIAASGDGYGRSDQQSFFAKKIPVLHFFTGTHEDYHRTTDDPDKINAEGIARVAELVAELAWGLATRPDSLTFVDAEPRERAPIAGGYGAYLGTIPDMTESPGGVRFTGVRAGSPAEQAGLQGGDILIRLGEFEINDLYDMTDALRSHRPGDTVTLQVRRDGEVLELTATLGRRGG
jgi:hypothetical protein